MKADPTHQVKLLDVADLDSRAGQLRHQRAHLPELAEIASLTDERTALTDQVRDARIVVDDLTVEQAKADREVEQVKTRRERDRNRMDTGQITNPKDLERMQHELVSLERRITTLEDAELEVAARDAERTEREDPDERDVADERGGRGEHGLQLVGDVVGVAVAVAVEVDQQHRADQDRGRRRQPPPELPPR